MEQNDKIIQIEAQLKLQQDKAFKYKEQCM